MYVYNLNKMFFIRDYTSYILTAIQFVNERK